MQTLSNNVSVMKENLIECEHILLHKPKEDILKQKEFGTDYVANQISIFCLVKRFSEGWGKNGMFIREDNPTNGKNFILLYILLKPYTKYNFFRLELLTTIKRHSSSYPNGADLLSITTSVKKLIP